MSTVQSDYPNAPAMYNGINTALDKLDDLLIAAQQAGRTGQHWNTILAALNDLTDGVAAAITTTTLAQQDAARRGNEILTRIMQDAGTLDDRPF
jgi:hypothetical protein